MTDEMRVTLSDGHLLVETADGRMRRDLHVDDVVAVRRIGNRLEIALTHGDSLSLESDAIDALESAVIDACCTLPELTRALHSLGSSRARSNANAQREFLAPLLEARRRAEESVGRASIVGAFDPERLTRALEVYVAALVERSADARPAARRAFAAAADEAVEPMRAAIATIRDLAPAAANPSRESEVQSWRRWRDALQALFTAADHCWLLLESGLDSGQRRDS